MQFTKNDIIKIGNQMAECTFDENGYIVDENPIPEKPEYCKCNKDHQLKLIYIPSDDSYSWDCPTCIDNGPRPFTYVMCRKEVA